MDADLVIDVRFLTNPYWEDSLRSKSGNDPEVYNFVLNDPRTQEFIVQFEAYLNYTLGLYKEQSKHHLTVAIGCTGGQHRSVSITNYLFDTYRKEYTVYKDHRDAVEEYV